MADVALLFFSLLSVGQQPSRRPLNMRTLHDFPLARRRPSGLSGDAIILQHSLGVGQMSEEGFEERC